MGGSRDLGRSCGGYHAEGHFRAFDATPLSPDPNVLRHWVQGPGRNIERLPEGEERTTSSGVTVPVSWRYSVWLDPDVAPGITAEQATEKLLDIWNHSRGWVRAGVWVRFVKAQANANCTLRVVPDADPGCAPATSCVRRASGHDSMVLRLAHLLYAAPFVPNHELGHALIMACDMYKYDLVDPSGYRGVMDNGLDKTDWTTDNDIRWCKQWLLGQAAYVSC